MLKIGLLAKACLLVASVFGIMTAKAQTNSGAVLTPYTMSDGSTFRALSDNGKWAIAYGANDATSQDAYPKLINLETKEITNLADENGAIVSNAGDVTDDGKMVVGSYNGYPATWNPQTKEWTKVAIPEGCDAGRINAVTPDGKYAVGTCNRSSDWLYEEPVMWDLTTGKIIPVNIPKYDTSNGYQNMTRFTGISADGRYICGCISFSYPQDVVYFFYDRETSTFDPVVFDFDENAKIKYTPKHDNVYGLDGICVSPNGKWIAGELYTMADERAPFRYNTETKELEYYLDAEDIDKGCVSIDNEGTVYAATPAVNPSRSLYIRHNGFWYGMDELLSQVYGINYYNHTGYQATGLTIGVSADCKSMVSIAYINSENYHVTLPETFGKACEKVNLLKKFTVSPLEGAAMAKVSNITLTFSRNIEVLGADDDVELRDENGEVVKTGIEFSVNANNSKIINIGFRTYKLEDGKDYTVVIPAGKICLKGDKTRTNEEIVIKYKGYGASALTNTAVSPENGSTMGEFDMLTSPVVFSFDTEVAVPADAKGYLYKVGEDAPVAELNILAGKTTETYKQVMLYPTATQYLYKGNTYKVVLPADAVTDLSGSVKNTECSVTYEGVYERTYESDDTNIFKENFELALGSMMQFDGDNKTPTSAFKEYGFAKGIGWTWAADDDYSNKCAMSHSKYVPNGKSDDWLVTPQLEITGKNVFLSFKGQGYQPGFTDKLKVVVWATDEKINDLDADVIAKFKSEGDVVFNEQMVPGATGTLEGNWKEYSVNLADYSGKKVYIAFVNENTNQSALFLTDVTVSQVFDVQVGLKGLEAYQIAATSQKVKGEIKILNEEKTYNQVKLQLLDSKRNIVDELVKSGLELKKDDTMEFEFNKELPLEVGKQNVFYVDVDLNDGETEYEMAVGLKNLSFKTTRRVVVEEETGQDCSNCPLGHLAMENLESVYGENVIPLCYHTYTGDSYESGMTSYTQSFLGLAGAPMAIINRYQGISSPMYREVVAGESKYSFVSPDADCWLDRVNYLMGFPADADISVSATYNKDTDVMNIPFNVRFALDMENANMGLFCVITEDKLEGYQQNNLYNTTAENLGEWQAGGIYGKSAVYPYTFNDVARNFYPANNYFGQTGLLPVNIENGVENKGEISFKGADILTQVKDINNCKVTVMLINVATGELLNSARTNIEITTGINSVTVDKEQNGPTYIYNVGGRAANEGLVIIKQGNSAKKVIK